MSLEKLQEVVHPFLVDRGRPFKEQLDRAQIYISRYLGEQYAKVPDDPVGGHVAVDLDVDPHELCKAKCGQPSSNAQLFQA